MLRPLTSENAFEVQIHGAQKKHLPVSDLTVTATVWACALGLLGLSGDVQQRVGVKLKSLALAQSPKSKSKGKALGQSISLNLVYPPHTHTHPTHKLL